VPEHPRQTHLAWDTGLVQRIVRIDADGTSQGFSILNATGTEAVEGAAALTRWPMAPPTQCVLGSISRLRRHLT
jgi:hypothetical protein